MRPSISGSVKQYKNGVAVNPNLTLVVASDGNTKFDALIGEGMPHGWLILCTNEPLGLTLVISKLATESA